MKSRTMPRPAHLALLLLSSTIQAKKALRVFQTLPSEPSEMDQNELMRNIRATQSVVFGDDGEKEQQHVNMYFMRFAIISIALQKYHH